MRLLIVHVECKIPQIATARLQRCKIEPSANRKRQSATRWHGDIARQSLLRCTAHADAKRVDCHRSRASAIGKRNRRRTQRQSYNPACGSRTAKLCT